MNSSHTKTIIFEFLFCFCFIKERERQRDRTSDRAERKRNSWLLYDKLIFSGCYFPALHCLEPLLHTSVGLFTVFCIIFDAFLQYFHLLSSFSYMPCLAPISMSFLWNYYLVYCPLSDWKDKLCSCGWLCCSGTKLQRALLTPLKHLPPVKYEAFWSFCNSFQLSVKLHYCTLPGNQHTYLW